MRAEAGPPNKSAVVRAFVKSNLDKQPQWAIVLTIIFANGGRLRGFIDRSKIKLKTRKANYVECQLAKRLGYIYLSKLVRIVTCSPIPRILPRIHQPHFVALFSTA